MTHSRPEFAVTITFVDGIATLAVSGDVDALTAPTLHGVVGALIDQNHLDIVLELSGLTFMDASGLSVIADVAGRLSTSNHILTVRSPPAMTRRILGITKLSELVRLESDANEVVDLDSEELRRLRIGSKPGLAATDAALRRVTELVSATVAGADGVSITLERNGRLKTVAASNETVMRMDGHQYDTGEGPCLSAASDGVGFQIDSLADETRWPAFVPLALEQGISSILSTPLRTIERSLGALNIYSNSEHIFGPQQQELAGLFASQASEILADAGEVDEQLNEHLADALRTRQIIARAQGVLMARLGIAANDAAAAIHQSARATGVAVAIEAATIVASTRTDDPTAT